MQNSFDIIIIGAGTAGMTAAVYARRAGKSVLLIECESFGGQIATSPNVENFPSRKSVSGAEFADDLYTQATDLGAKAEVDRVVKITDNGAAKTVTTEYAEYESKAVIIATGLKHKGLSLPREGELVGNGISYCAVCDGVFYKDKAVAVCGGGNTALSDAIYLSDFCSSVTLIHRRAEFRGEARLVELLRSKKNVHFELEKTISAYKGDKNLTGVTLKNVGDGQEKDLDVSGLFLAVGQAPQSGIFTGLVDMDEGGFIKAGEDCLTSRAGVFAAGDCRTKEVRQLTTAAADGSVAAIAACRYADML